MRNYEDRHLDRVKRAAAYALVTKHNTHVAMSKLYIVWFNFTLGNYKALLSTVVVPDIYIEVTFREATEEFYVDIYKKQSNSTITLEIL